MLNDLWQYGHDFLNETFIQQFNFWILFGFIAQAMFFMRFFVQWLASEFARKSVIPLSFWIFSLLGGIMLLVYSIYRRDPVYIIGQLFGILIYCRNISLIYRERVKNETDYID